MSKARYSVSSAVASGVCEKQRDRAAKPQAPAGKEAWKGPFHGVPVEMSYSRTNDDGADRPWPSPNGGSSAQGSLSVVVADVTAKDHRHDGLLLDSSNLFLRQACSIQIHRRRASLELVRTSLADVLEPFSASRLAGGHGKEPSPLAGLAAAEIPWPFAPKHTVPVMAANPHTTAHTFLARILAPWAEALSPVPLRNSSKSRRRLSSDKRRWSSHCALVHSPRSSQAATCILVLRFSKADQVALRTNHNRSSPPSLLGFGIGIQLRAKGTLRGGACTYTVESISAFCHDRRPFRGGRQVRHEPRTG